MQSIRSIRFDQNKAADPDRPVQTELWYEHSGGPVRSGFWASQPSRIEIDFSQGQFEFCSILEGRVRLTDAQGHVEIYSAGDAFIMPAGFKGVWETLDPVRKFFLYSEPAG